MGLLSHCQVSPAGFPCCLVIESNAQGVYAALEVSTVLLKPSFYLEQNPTSTDNTDTHQLVLANIPDGVTTLKVKMIVPLSQIDLFDDVVIPSGKEMLIVQAVVGLLQGKPLEDMKNDGL